MNSNIKFWQAIANCLGLMVGVEKPGFCFGYQELSVECGKETRFLGFWGSGVDGGGIETGFLLWVSGFICGMRRRNPVSGVPKIK
ncbi:hypothetical protein [Planktothricoides raciborskii]|uniref:Uncharacterized protein n=1 Tax=Planktothricoides raciborskii GIHE-MW2 TaxID=2792601 RepID=A0AAU8JL49_9CYAN